MRCAQTPAVVLVLAFVLARVFAAPIPASGATAPTTAVAAAQSGMVRTAHVSVNYSGITAPQAESLGRVAEAARAAAVKRYGFDVPETITVNVDCRIGNTVRLFTDGQDTYTLSIRSGFDLSPPGVCGIYNLYGMCHELGHVVMYRVIRDHGWMTSVAAEAWAHYFGSRVVDDVYASAGEEVWWMPYDYRSDGMARLRAQLDETRQTDETRAAGAWLKLVEIVGEQQMPALFAAWAQAPIDLTDPAPAIRSALKGISGDERIDAWWATAEPVLVKKRPRSPLATAASAPATAPAGKPVELTRDDGKSAGMRSISGGGHAVKFETPDGAGGFVLTSVKLFGSRYGTPQPPNEDFHVFLCDSDGKVIKDFAFPYKLFLRGDPKWVTLKCEPTPVPKEFIVAVSFNPSRTKGVYVHYDAAADGDSRAGTPPDLNDAFSKGDWMIRAVVNARGAGPTKDAQKE